MSEIQKCTRTLLTTLSLIEFDVVCAVLSMFFLLVKSVMYVMGALLPCISILVHACLIALYAIATRNQASPDLSNMSVPNLQRNMPWYLSKGCGYATSSTKGYCEQAVASFAITVLML